MDRRSTGCLCYCLAVIGSRCRGGALHYSTCAVAFKTGNSPIGLGLAMTSLRDWFCDQVYRQHVIFMMLLFQNLVVIMIPLVVLNQPTDPNMAMPPWRLMLYRDHASMIVSSRTWMLWPTRPDYWGSCARPGQMAFAGVANAIGKFEPVMVGVPPGHEHFAMSLLDPSTTTVVPVEQDDCWIRDTGPLFVVKEDPRGKGGRQLRGVDWSFNAWGGLLGGCYSTWEKDDMVASTVLRLTGARRYKSRMILEVGHGCERLLQELYMEPNWFPVLHTDTFAFLTRQCWNWTLDTTLFGICTRRG